MSVLENHIIQTQEPIFYILDFGLCRAMFVKKEDEYEYKGFWMQLKAGEVDSWPACLSKGELQEYITNYEFSKNKGDVMDFLQEASLRTPLTSEQMQYLNQDQSFHY